MDDKFKELRERIDSIDVKMLELLNKRAEVSIEVGRIKAEGDEQIFKPFREKALLAKLVSQNSGPIPDSHLNSIYREILSSSRRLQRPERVVYLGPEGTFSYIAAMAYLGRSADMAPKRDFEAIFKAVTAGEADLGVIPLENSLQGTVGQSVDLFMRYPVFIQAEIFCRIGHCLMGKEGTSLSEITEVMSHSKALEQCTGWTRTNVPQAEIVPVQSTGEAAWRVAEGEGKTAAVGHSKLAERYRLKVLAEHIEDLPDNWTRFFIIGRAETPAGNRDKTSILFTAPDKPGALAKVLEILADGGINLTKLESRPLTGERWKYVFFADLECDLAQTEFENLLEEFRANCHTLRILGSYPTGPSIDPGAME